MKETTKIRRTIYLSRSERRFGGRRYLRFVALNGLGMSFLGSFSISLLAIHFGAGNLELGIISAMLHISGIFLLVVPLIFRGKNVVTVGFWAWIIRGLISLPYMALLFINGQKAVILILILYALFCLARTVGISMVNTVHKRLMVSRTQGDALFRAATSFQGTMIISRIISYTVLSLKYFAELSGLLALQALGIIFNTLAAFQFRRIPNRTQVEYKKGQNLFIILAHNMRNRRRRKILTLRWISLGQVILFAMTIPFLRRSVEMELAQIYVFTISISLAAFFSSLSFRPVVRRAGSRPLLFFVSIPTVLMFLFWAVIPENLTLGAYAITGFATMFFVSASELGANRLLFSIIPDDRAVGFNAMETFVTSILALILGFTAGYLANISPRISNSIPINNFGMVFLPASLGAIAQAIIAFGIKEPGSMGLKESARVLSNISNLRAWQTVSALETTANPIKRKTLINSVGHSRAPAALSEIRKILSEPLSHEKGELIDALFLTRRPELLDFLCDEAQDPSSFHRGKAIFALGAYPGTQSENTLLQLLNDQDSSIQATAAKSLGRIGSKTELITISERWKNTQKLRERLDYMIALFHMDPDRQYIADLFSPMIASTGERSQRTLLTLLANQFGLVPPLGIIYGEESTRYGKGIELLLEESRDTQFILECGDKIETLWTENNYFAVWQLCQETLNRTNPPLMLIPMIRALQNFPQDKGSAANTLAALYFTYQILTAEDG